MTTIFDRLDSMLGDNNISVSISGQAGQLTNIINSLQSLINNPPDEVGDLIGALGNRQLPNLELDSSIASNLAQIENLLPSDLTEFTDELTSALSSIDDQVNVIADSVGEALRAAIEFHNLSKADWTCRAEFGGSGGSASGSGNGGEGGGGAEGGEGGEGGENDQETSGTQAVNTINQTVTETNAVLDLFPEPMTIEGLLESLANITRRRTGNQATIINIPVFDELRDVLDTVLAWRSMSAAELEIFLSDAMQQIVSLLENSGGHLLSPVETVLTDLNTTLPLSSLDDVFSGLASHYATLAAAVESGDLSGAAVTIAEANVLFDQLDGLRPALTSADLVETVENTVERMRTLPDDLADSLQRVVLLLDAPAEVELAGRLLAEINTQLSTLPLADFEATGNAITEWLEDLTDGLDFSAIQQPISDVADAVRTATDELDQALVRVTLQIQDMFEQADQVLAGVDTTAIISQAEDAFKTFGDELTQSVMDLFGPARDGISTVVTKLESTVTEFDPAQLIIPVQEVLNKITGVLSEGDVATLIERIRATLDDVAAQIENLSFAPLTDKVVKAIEDIADELRAINTDDLSTTLQMALQAALAVLPESLSPLIAPLTDEFGELVESGPVLLLDKVKDQPARLMDNIRRFEPGTLLGDSLQEPFGQVVKQMEAFRPSALFDLVSDEFDLVKQRLIKDADPAVVLAPLQTVYNQASIGLQQIQPDALVAPLEEALNEAVNQVIDVIPLEEVFDQVDPALDLVQQIFTSMGGARDLLLRIQNMLDALADPRPKLEAMMAPVLAMFDGITDTSFLNTAMNSLQSSLQEMRAAGIQSRIDTALASISTKIESLDPEQQVIGMLQSHRDFPHTALLGLPESTEKTNLLTLLDRADPMAPGFSDPFEPVVQLHTAINELREALPTTFEHWDERFYAADTTLGELANFDSNATVIKELLRDTLDEQFIEPLSQVLGLLAPIRLTVGNIAGEFAYLIGELEERVGALLTGPGSLQAIRDELNTLVDRLRNFNLDFLTDSLQERADALLASWEALNPASFREPLQKALQDMVNALNLDTLMPAAEITSLDRSYDGILDILRGLDPVQTVLPVLQSHYEENVVPLLDSFDISALLEGMMTKLNNLEEELGSELERVDAAYQELRGAVPSISISIDVGISF